VSACAPRAPRRLYLEELLQHSRVVEHDGALDGAVHVRQCWGVVQILRLLEYVYEPGDPVGLQQQRRQALALEGRRAVQHLSARGTQADSGGTHRVTHARCQGAPALGTCASCLSLPPAAGPRRAAGAGPHMLGGPALRRAPAARWLLGVCSAPLQPARALAPAFTGALALQPHTRHFTHARLLLHTLINLTQTPGCHHALAPVAQPCPPMRAVHKPGPSRQLPSRSRAWSIACLTRTKAPYSRLHTLCCKSKWAEKG